MAGGDPKPTRTAREGSSNLIFYRRGMGSMITGFLAQRQARRSISVPIGPSAYPRLISPPDRGGLFLGKLRNLPNRLAVSPGRKSTSQI
jgi:hypothetical protein